MIEKLVVVVANALPSVSTCACSTSHDRLQENTQSWRLNSTWRGKSATLWSRRTCPASWPSSSPRSPSGSTESRCRPGPSLVSARPIGQEDTVCFLPGPGVPQGWRWRTTQQLGTECFTPVTKRGNQKTKTWSQVKRSQMKNLSWVHVCVQVHQTRLSVYKETSLASLHQLFGGGLVKTAKKQWKGSNCNTINLNHCNKLKFHSTPVLTDYSNLIWMWPISDISICIYFHSVFHCFVKEAFHQGFLL